MGRPILSSLFRVGIGIASIGLRAAIVPTPDFAVILATMIGIGAGIDYSLFIVTRDREALHRGRSA